MHAWIHVTNTLCHCAPPASAVCVTISSEWQTISYSFCMRVLTEALLHFVNKQLWTHRHPDETLQCCYIWRYFLHQSHEYMNEDKTLYRYNLSALNNENTNMPVCRQNTSLICKIWTRAHSAPKQHIQFVKHYAEHLYLKKKKECFRFAHVHSEEIFSKCVRPGSSLTLIILSWIICSVVVVILYNPFQRCFWCFHNEKINKKMQAEV